MLDPPAAAFRFQHLPRGTFGRDHRCSSCKALGDRHAKIFAERRQNEEFSPGKQLSLLIPVHRLANLDSSQRQVSGKPFELVCVPAFARTEDKKAPAGEVCLEQGPRTNKAIQPFLRMNSSKRDHNFFLWLGCRAILQHVNSIRDDCYWRLQAKGPNVFVFLLTRCVKKID